MLTHAYLKYLQFLKVYRLEILIVQSMWQPVCDLTILLVLSWKRKIKLQLQYCPATNISLIESQNVNIKKIKNKAHSRGMFLFASPIEMSVL